MPDYTPATVVKANNRNANLTAAKQQAAAQQTTSPLLVDPDTGMPSFAYTMRVQNSGIQLGAPSTNGNAMYVSDTGAVFGNPYHKGKGDGESPRNG